MLSFDKILGFLVYLKLRIFHFTYLGHQIQTERGLGRLYEVAGTKVACITALLVFLNENIRRVFVKITLDYLNVLCSCCSEKSRNYLLNCILRSHKNFQKFGLKDARKALGHQG